MSWPQADVDAHYAKLKRGVEPPQTTTDLIAWSEPKPAPKPTGRTPWTAPMNANERAYDAYLRTLYVAGEVLWWGFEVLTIKLGFDGRLTPDFLILFSDGRLEMHDTKGAKKIKTGKRAGETKPYATEDAAVKARVAAAHFPIPIYFVWSLGDGGWGKKGFGE